MFIPIGAASSALSYLQSLLAMGASAAGDAKGTDPISSLLDGQTGSDPTTGASPPAAASIDPASGSSKFKFDAGMMAALISLQSQSQSQSASVAAPQGPSQLFTKLDTDGDGQISKSEFETALGNDGVDASSADALFGKLDANGDGSIDQSELASARHGHHHHHMHADDGSQAAGASGQNPIDALLASATANGAQTKTATNSDGSTTTTISYADGSTVEMTTPAASTDNSGNTGSGVSGQNTANLLEQLIRLQAQLLNAVPPTLSAVA